MASPWCCDCTLYFVMGMRSETLRTGLSVWMKKYKFHQVSLHNDKSGKNVRQIVLGCGFDLKQRLSIFHNWVTSRDNSFSCSGCNRFNLVYLFTGYSSHFSQSSQGKSSAKGCLLEIRNWNEHKQKPREAFLNKFQVFRRV